MIVVPLKGDTVETKDGVTFTVLSFTNYRDKGPAVYVEHTATVPSSLVYFFDIIKINGKTVEFMKGPKVFNSIGPITQKIQLPQFGDTITWKLHGENYSGLVKGYKLHKRNELARGLQFIVKEATGEEHFVRLDSLIDVDRSIGNDLFSRDKFLTLYNDYRGSQ